jgi:uncharacterized protein (UPF0276 family)
VANPERPDVSLLPTLGAGMGFRAKYRADIFAQPKAVDFLEITADHYLDATREKRRELRLLADHFVLIPHGLHLSLGSADGPDPRYVRKLADLISYLQPPWWSEHIAFTGTRDYDIGHLAPLPFTHQAVEVISRNVDRVRQAIDVALILENIAYIVAMPVREMNEAEFVRRVLEGTGCGLLLDVTNLHTNAVNHRYDAQAFLRALPPKAVVQLHFAGVLWRDGLLVDSHSEPTPAEAWQLMKAAMELFPVKGAILERDDNLPAFSELAVEVEKARRLGKECELWD